MGLVDAPVPSLIVSPLLVTVFVSAVLSINSLNSRWRSHALTEAQHEHPDNGVSTQHPSNKLSSHHLRENIWISLLMPPLWSLSVVSSVWCCEMGSLGMKACGGPACGPIKANVRLNGHSPFWLTCTSLARFMKELWKYIWMDFANFFVSIYTAIYTKRERMDEVSIL